MAGKNEYDQCHGKESDIKEGHKSFPSVHTRSFAGLGFLSLYDRRGHVAKLCIVFLPLLMASLVGVSRVDDYWHHWQDVFAGGLIGWGPYAYFRAVEEVRSSRQRVQPANGGSEVARPDVQLNQQSHTTTSPFEDV